MSGDLPNMRLLVADDEPLERQAIRLIIERAAVPFIVIGEARHGSEALRLAVELKPDIVLMDIKMPGMDGLAAAREIKKALPSCALIFLTAYDDFNYAQKALRVGASDYLLKPLKASELLEILNKVRFSLLEARAEQEEQKKLHEQLTEALPWIRVNLALGLTFGLWEERAAVEQQASLVQLKVLPQVALVAYMENRPQEKTTRLEVLRFQLQRVVEEALIKYPHGLCLLLSEHMLVILWGTREQQPGQTLEQLAKHIIKTSAEKLSLGVTIGVGGFCEDINQIPRSVWEAQTAAHYGMFFLGPERVVAIDELERENDRGDILSNAKEREMLAALRSGDREEVRSRFRALLRNGSAGWGSDIYQSKARLMNILTDFIRGLGQRWQGKRMVESEFAYNEFTRRLALCRSVEELEEWLVELAEAGENMHSGQSTGAVSEAVKRALSYIHENFQHELSLTELSQLIFVSTDYFSRLFKEQVGCTFSEYIQRLRVDKAKELLKDSDLPVGEVAHKVGYSDHNYFSRVFGRTVGISPSRYRQMFYDRN